MSYTVSELAAAIEASEKTILRWIEFDGLQPILGSKKPLLVMGEEAKRFIKARNSKPVIKLKRHEFYCLKCRAARRAKRGTIVLLDGMKTGLCSVCNSKIRKTIGPYQKDYYIPAVSVQMSLFNSNLIKLKNDKS